MYFGSKALKYWYPDLKRDPADIDIMSEDDIMTPNEQHYWVPTFKEIIELSSNKEYLDPDLLLTIKASHANWNIHWDKTMVDIMFLKEKGHEINVPIYKKLIKDWTKVHGKMSAPLKGKTSKTFFEDAVPRKYIHDDIHKVIAFYDEPLYSRILKGDGTVYLLRYEGKEENLKTDSGKAQLAEILDIKNDPDAWNAITSNSDVEFTEATLSSVKKLFSELENGEIGTLVSLDGMAQLDSKESLMYGGKGSFKIGDYLLTQEENYGGEGQGDDYWVVFSIKKEGDEKYFKWDGWYASHDGGYLENLYEVTPTVVEVIQWVNVK